MQNYVEAFEASDRLHDVLVWALVAGRLTDEEVESIEASVTAEAVERQRQAERIVEYQQWLVDVELRHREERQRRDRERSDRNESYFRWWKWLRELELTGRLSEATSFEEWAARYRPRAATGGARDAGSIPARSTTSKRAQEAPWQ